MTEKKRTEKILSLLDEHYPVDEKCYLNYEEPYQLLFSTILSAQCTDDRVNAVTETLYKKYPTLESFAEADLAELIEDVRSTGYFTAKAKNIIGSAQKILNEFGGAVPGDIERLTSLPGVGRKTANVVRGHVFGAPSVVVDTHVKRISNLLGFVDSDDPVKIEFELMKILPEDHWIRYNLQVITHGRTICVARRPKCGDCFLNGLCAAGGKPVS